jgi:hypothetical protein
VLPARQALAELQVALRVMEALEALPQRLEALLMMATVLLLDGEPGKTIAVCRQALELLPAWHEQAAEIRQCLAGAGDGEASDGEAAP